jgi:hypothetical protein
MSALNERASGGAAMLGHHQTNQFGPGYDTSTNTPSSTTLTAYLRISPVSGSNHKLFKR